MVNVPIKMINTSDTSGRDFLVLFFVSRWVFILLEGNWVILINPLLTKQTVETYLASRDLEGIKDMFRIRSKKIRRKYT
jgi:hypothetical protein